MEKLEQIIQKIEGMEQLVHGEYRADNGCMCAVGVFMDDYGILGKVASNSYLNTCGIPELQMEGLDLESMAANYGLDVADLEQLQAVNDESADEYRKEQVLNYLKEVLKEHE